MMIDDPRDDTAVEKANKVDFMLKCDAVDASLRTIADIALKLGTKPLAKNIKITPKELSDLIETLGKIQKAMPRESA
jgi:hypothetical protein